MTNHIHVNSNLKMVMKSQYSSGVKLHGTKYIITIEPIQGLAPSSDIKLQNVKRVRYTMNIAKKIVETNRSAK